MNIKIKMFGEENRTMLAINFIFRKAYAIFTAVIVIVIALIWVVAVNMVEAIVITTIIGTCGSITFALEISKAKRSFLDDIREAFDLLNKMD